MIKQKQVSVKGAIITLAVLAVGVTAATLYAAQNPIKRVRNFDECIAAGGARLESYPEQCMYNKKSYVNEEQYVPEEPVTSDGSEYIGLSENDAFVLAKESHVTARVVERNGESLPMTMDYRQGRHNLYIRDDKVYKVDVEGGAVDTN